MSVDNVAGFLVPPFAACQLDFFVFDAHYKRAQPGKCKGAKRRSEPLLFSGGARIMRQTKTKSVIDKEKDVCRHLIMSVILWRQESAAV